MTAPLTNEIRQYSTEGAASFDSIDSEDYARPEPTPDIQILLLGGTF